MGQKSSLQQQLILKFSAQDEFFNVLSFAWCVQLDLHKPEMAIAITKFRVLYGFAGMEVGDVHCNENGF